MTERTERISQLGFYQHFCRAIPYSLGAQHAVRLLRKREATFLHGMNEIVEVKPLLGMGGEISDEPGAVLDADGSIISALNLQHRLLTPDVTTLCAICNGGFRPGSGAFGNFGFFPDSQTVHVGQNADVTNQLGVEVDTVATGLLALALHFYSSLCPNYGWVDEFGWNLPEGTALSCPNPRYLFWANFFGPEFVKTVGLDFLKGAPGWTSVNLEDGGILHVSTESYRAWWENDQPELLAYFRRKFPTIQIYRAKPIPY